MKNPVKEFFEKASLDDLITCLEKTSKVDLRNVTWSNFVDDLTKEIDKKISAQTLVIGKFAEYDKFDVAAALYVWLSENHEGQYSDEYEALSKLSEVFKPGLSVERGELGAEEQAIYDVLDSDNYQEALEFVLGENTEANYKITATIAKCREEDAKPGRPWCIYKHDHPKDDQPKYWPKTYEAKKDAEEALQMMHVHGSGKSAADLNEEFLEQKWNPLHNRYDKAIDDAWQHLHQLKMWVPKLSSHLGKQEEALKKHADELDKVKRAIEDTMIEISDYIKSEKN